MPDMRPKYQFRAQLDTGPRIEMGVRTLERLAATKAWEGWLRHYQQLLDDHPDGLLPTGKGRWVGLRHALEERFQALPAAVSARYRRLYDGPAAAALDQAVGHGDPAEVTRVYARFRFTSVGPRALAWLADRALDGGDAERAWLAYSRLVAQAGGGDPPKAGEPELAGWMARAITAGDLAGHPTEAAALAGRLSSRLGDRPLKISGHALAARDWVRSRGKGSAVSPGAASGTGAWIDFAGGPDRRREMTGTASPQLRPAWQQTVPGAGVGLPDYYYDRGRPRWGPAYRYPGVARFSYLPFPTVADGRVYAPMPGAIRCYSLADGQPLWTAREADLAPQRRYPTPGGFRWWRPQRSTQSVAVVAGHLLLTRLPAGSFENDSSGWPGEFVLAALDARTGALLWERSAGNGPPDSFYNMPVVAGQTLYTGISTSLAGLTEYRAAALDAATGDRLWTTYLGSGSDPMAGVDGSPAVVRGDTVWVESCLHTLDALDALTGEIEWMTAFQPDIAAPERSGWQDTMTVTNEPVGLIALQGDRLLFSPRWGSQLVAVNARTGQQLWSAESGGSHSLVAVNRSRAVLAGDQIRSVNPANGQVQWTWKPPPGARFGYPALVGDKIVAPMGTWLVFLDAATGSERGRLSLRESGAQPAAATLLVLGRRLLFAQADRLLALDDLPPAAQAAAPSGPEMNHRDTETQRG